MIEQQPTIRNPHQIQPQIIGCDELLDELFFELDHADLYDDEHDFDFAAFHQHQEQSTAP